MSFHPPGILPGGNEAVGAHLVLGNFKAGSHKAYLSLKIDSITKWQPEIETYWFPHYGWKFLAAAAAGKNQYPLSQENGLTKRPLTLTAIVTETRDANEFLLLLADIFDTAKPTLQTELEKLALESKRKEAELTELKTIAANSKDYYTSWVDAETKILQYCEESQTGNSSDAKKDRLAKSRDARIAQLDANVKALVAGFPTPFKSFVAVSDNPVPSECP